MLIDRLAIQGLHDIASARNGYNLLMPRAALFALLVASMLDSSLQAQRASSSFRGSVVRSSSRSGLVRRPRLTDSFFPARVPLRYNGLGYIAPYDELFAEEQPDGEAVSNGEVSHGNEPAVIILPPQLWPSRIPEPRVLQPKVIEIPRDANSIAKLLPPAIFVLSNGERLEARRFVLTANSLSVSMDRRQRTIPLAMLDLNATMSANHERGIDLRIPADRTEISLSF
jgi:hypothetical protein